MDVSGIVVHPAGEGDFEASVQFLMDWVSDGKAGARRYLAGRAGPGGASVVATGGHDVVGYVAVVRESGFAGFRGRGIPLVRRVAVAGSFQRQGVAMLLMDAAGQLARERGITTPGMTAGLSGEYGPAQRLHGRRGYGPDGREHARASDR